jgi:hypothetical protein
MKRSMIRSSRWRPSRSRRISGAEISIISSLSPGFALSFVFFLISHLALTVVDERDRHTAPPDYDSCQSQRHPVWQGAAVLRCGGHQLVFTLLVCNMVFGMGWAVTLALAVIILSTGYAWQGLGSWWQRW